MYNVNINFPKPHGFFKSKCLKPKKQQQKHIGSKILLLSLLSLFFVVANLQLYTHKV